MKLFVQNHSDPQISLQGAERALLDQLDHWATLNSELEIVVLSLGRPGIFTEHCRQRGWQHFSLPLDWWLEEIAVRTSSFREAQSLADIGSISIVREILRETAPDIAITNTIAAPWTAFAAASENIPHVWFCHETGQIGDSLSFRYGERESWEIVGELSDFVVANSNGTFDFLSAYFEPDKIMLQHPAAAPERLNAFREMRTSEDDALSVQRPAAQLRVGVFGAISRQKNQALVIEAVKILHRQGMRIEVLIVGSSSNLYLEELRRNEAFSEVREYVSLLPSVHDALPLMEACDIVICPSIAESFGLVALEAQFLGKPVIAASSPGSRDILEPEVSGFILEKNDPVELSNRIRQYALSPDLRRHHGQNAHIRAISVLKNAEKSSQDLLGRLELLSRNGKSTVRSSALKVLLENSNSLIKDHDINKVLRHGAIVVTPSRLRRVFRRLIRGLSK